VLLKISQKGALFCSTPAKTMSPRNRDTCPTIQPLLAATTVTGAKSRALNAYAERMNATGATVGDAEREPLPQLMRFGLVGAILTALVGAGGTVGSTFLAGAAFDEAQNRIRPPPCAQTRQTRSPLAVSLVTNLRALCSQTEPRSASKSAKSSGAAVSEMPRTTRHRSAC
jgi:hypothetical protein